MGVMCQIFLQKPVDDVFRPGYPVKGIVKYAFDEDIELKDITVSCFGKAHCEWRETHSSGKDRRDRHYWKDEDLFTYQTSVLNKDGMTKMLYRGSYEDRINFILPSNLPSTYKDNHSYVKYYIEIRFKRPGIFRFDKKFYKTIDVKGYVTSSIAEPCIYGLEKKILKLFSAKKHIVTLKATINKSLVNPGDKVILDLDVTNNSDVIIPSIVTKLIGHIIYKSNCGSTMVLVLNPKDCQAKTASIPDNGTAILKTIIPTRPEIFSLQNTEAVSIDYFLRVTVKLPLPHFNSSVDIPVVIGESGENMRNPPELGLEPKHDPPPSYWEVMIEEGLEGKENNLATPKK